MKIPCFTSSEHAQAFAVVAKYKISPMRLTARMIRVHLLFKKEYAKKTCTNRMSWLATQGQLIRECLESMATGRVLINQ